MLYIAAAPAAGELHDAAWELLYSLLGRIGLEKKEIFREKSGKPYVAGNEYFFSLSHTEGAVCCVVSTNVEKALDDVIVIDEPISSVGIDIECIEREANFAAIAKGFFTENEREFLKNDETAERFYQIYTAKEALVKASGEGLAGMRKQKSVSETDGIYSYDLALNGRKYKMSVAIEKAAD